MTADRTALPSLPEPLDLPNGLAGPVKTPLFTAEQMHAYALAALQSLRPAGCELVDSAELARLRERDRVQTMATVRGDVWYWQGDGHDLPESLTCPVIMSAETLRALTRPAGSPSSAALVGLESIRHDLLTLDQYDDDEMRSRVLQIACRVKALTAAEAQGDDLLPLQQFATAIIGDDGELGSWDGGDIQDTAEACGLLVPTEVTEPCSEETCACAGYGDFPMTCYRYSPTLRRAQRAAAGAQEKGNGNR